ncbi:MAG: InlB B-repeat-containing protein [Clostridia bacterium]|nr:InlB B-repeat-containing protein [Clostridia bacterium]
MNKKIFLLLIIIVLIVLTVLMISLIEKGFRITFDYNYEGAPEPIIVYVKYHKALSLPSNPTRQGYTFTGWYTDTECTQMYDCDSRIENDLILYAGWQPVN